MLTTADRLKDFTIRASDDDIGRIEEFYFDDETWTIRYMIVNTGDWLFGRRVLISPIFLRQVDWEAKRLDFLITKKQIENSPDIDTQKPVSRQHESDYMKYYQSPFYWGGSDIWGSGPYPAGLLGMLSPLRPRRPDTKPEPEDSHLRSTATVTGYAVEAIDGDVGKVADFLVDLDTWTVRYLEIKPAPWWSEKDVLVSPEWIKEVSWVYSKITLDLTRESVKSAPEYVQARTMTREYEVQPHEHYDRLPYGLEQPGVNRLPTASPASLK